MTLTLETVAKLANANAYRFDWVFAYMTEETAQHRGHLDIVVEWDSRHRKIRNRRTQRRHSARLAP